MRFSVYMQVIATQRKKTRRKKHYIFIIVRYRRLSATPGFDPRFPKQFFLLVETPFKEFRIPAVEHPDMVVIISYGTILFVRVH